MRCFACRDFLRPRTLGTTTSQYARARALILALPKRRKNYLGRMKMLARTSWNGETGSLPISSLLGTVAWAAMLLSESIVNVVTLLQAVPAALTEWSETRPKLECRFRRQPVRALSNSLIAAARSVAADVQHGDFSLMWFQWRAFHKTDQFRAVAAPAHCYGQDFACAGRSPLVPLKLSWRGTANAVPTCSTAFSISINSS